MDFEQIYAGVDLIYEAMHELDVVWFLWKFIVMTFVLSVVFGIVRWMIDRVI